MSEIKPISRDEWISSHVRHAAANGKRYVLLCNEAGGFLRRVYVPDPPPDYVSHAGSVFQRQGTGRYWRVRDYPVTGVVEATSYA